MNETILGLFSIANLIVVAKVAFSTGKICQKIEDHDCRIKALEDMRCYAEDCALRPHGAK